MKRALFLFLFLAVLSVFSFGCEKSFYAESAPAITLDPTPNTAQPVLAEFKRGDGSRVAVMNLLVRDKDGNIVTSAAVADSKPSYYEDVVKVISSGTNGAIAGALIGNGLSSSGTKVNVSGSSASSSATSSSGP